MPSWSARRPLSFREYWEQSKRHGAFVKFHDARWWEVPDSVAREKVACMFRDSLSGIYRSSNKNKVERRRAKKALQRSEQDSTPPLTPSCTKAEETLFSLIGRNLEQLPAIDFRALEFCDMFESVDETIFDDATPATTMWQVDGFYGSFDDEQMPNESQASEDNYNCT